MCKNDNGDDNEGDDDYYDDDNDDIHVIGDYEKKIKSVVWKMQRKGNVHYFKRFSLAVVFEPTKFNILHNISAAINKIREERFSQ